MTCEELQSGYLPYALGTIEEPERSEVRAHLDRGCPNCVAGMRDARLLAYGFGASLAGPEPPRHLRGKVLASVGAAPEPRRNRIAGWIAAAAMAAVTAALFLFMELRHTSEVAALQHDLERSATSLAAAREALDLIRAPETREVVFGEGAPAPPHGRVFFARSGILLIASSLPAPPAGKTYEMWIIRDSKPAPAGLFRSSAQGEATHVYRTAAAPAPGEVVAVTLEPEGGVGAPTSQPVIAAQLPR